MDVCFGCCVYDFFFWLMPILSRLISIAFSCMDFEPTMKLSWSDVQPGFLNFLRMFMRFSYCLYVMSFFVSR